MTTVESNHGTILDDTGWCFGRAQLLHRCYRRFGWNADFARRVLGGYGQFLACKAKLTKEKALDRLLEPSPAVHRMWIEHIIDTSNYIRTCQQTFHVEYIHRRAIALEEGPWRPRNPEALQVSLYAMHGFDAIDQEVWQFDHTSSSSGTTARDVKEATQNPQQEEEKESHASQMKIMDRSMGQTCDGAPHDRSVEKKNSPKKTSAKAKRCNICGKFVNSRIFHIHHALCNGKGKKSCPICAKRFVPRGLRLHYNRCRGLTLLTGDKVIRGHIATGENASADGV